MAIKDEKQQTDLISRYYKEPDSRSKILGFFLEHFSKDIDRQWKFAKALPLHQREKDSEAITALIGAFEEVRETPTASLTNAFLNRLRRSIRRDLTFRKGHIDINSMAIEDGEGTPEDQYILKEQMELLKDFIQYNYDLKTYYQFQLYFMDGWTADEIGRDYGVTGRSVSKRMAIVYERAQRYMKRINNE